MNLGSWKCGHNVRVYFDNDDEADRTRARHMAGSRGLMRNHYGPQVPVEKAKTFKFWEADGDDSANVYSNADCSGGSAYLMTDAINFQETRIALVFGDF